MTMLDRMRRHKSWLKWSLAVVCLAFVAFYVPAFLGSEKAAAADEVASVDGRKISVDEFRKIYQRQLSDYRTRFGGNVSDQLLKQLGIDQQILQQMIDEETIMSAAARAGITVTDREVAERLLTLPEFQDNGQFIGQERYEALLRMQRTPITTTEFEESLRKRLVIQKMQAALTSWMTVSDDEADREYRQKNEKVKLDVLVFPAEKYRSDVTVSDAEVASYFDAHKEQYRVGERRRVRYLLVDVDAMRPKVTVPSRDVERFYNENMEMYTTPEQVRASHILFKTEGKTDAQVAEIKAKAEKVLAEAKGGADFAALAKKYSEDEASAKQGGDLDFFGKGKMVPEFDQVVFAMEPGQISDLVKTQYGFHIIKLVDKKAAVVKSFDEVRPQILDQLTSEQASTKAASESGAMEKEISKPGDLDKAAASRGLKVQESGYFTKDQPIMGLGPSPEGVAQVFQLTKDQVTGAVPVGRGFAFMSVIDIQPPHLPKLDEVKDAVREDLTKQKTKEIARAKAAAVTAAAKTGDFAKAAKAAGVEVKTTELIAREAPIPEIGASPQVDQVAFAMTPGAVSDPIVTDNGVVVIRLVERKDPTPAEVITNRDKTRDDLLNDRRNRFFSAYMIKARQAMKISINREAVQKVIG